MKCPKCRIDNPETVKFCGECGAPLTPAPGPAASPKPADFPRPSGADPHFPSETLRLPVQELALGLSFAGRYQVIEELGLGGMGRVYKVLDTKIQEKVALKLINPDVSLDPETIERFSNELKLARKVR